MYSRKTTCVGVIRHNRNTVIIRTIQSQKQLADSVNLNTLKEFMSFCWQELKTDAPHLVMGLK